MPLWSPVSSRSRLPSESRTPSFSILDAATGALPDIEIVAADTTQVEAEFAETRVPVRVGGGSEEPPISTGGGSSGGSGSVDGPPENAPAPDAGGGAAKPPGRPPIPVPGPIGPGDGRPDDEGFNADEQEIADKLIGEDHTVTHVYNDPRFSTPDALVDGVPTEFKTLRAGSGANTVLRAPASPRTKR